MKGFEETNLKKHKKKHNILKLKQLKTFYLIMLP
jgi:hypothetical protein